MQCSSSGLFRLLWWVNFVVLFFIFFFFHSCCCCCISSLVLRLVGAGYLWSHISSQRAHNLRHGKQYNPFGGWGYYEIRVHLRYWIIMPTWIWDRMRTTMTSTFGRIGLYAKLLLYRQNSVCRP